MIIGLSIWVVFSLIAAVMGSDKKIGFWGTFFLSLVLSPLIGFIVAVFSADVETKKDAPKSTVATTFSMSDELAKISALKDSGALTQDEFDLAKSKILAQ